VGLASTKTAEIVAPKSSLTPCILDDDPAQLEMLSAVIADMGGTRPSLRPIRRRHSRDRWTKSRRSTITEGGSGRLKSNC